MKPQFKRLLLLIIALIIIAGGGVFLWQHFNHNTTQSTNETQIADTSDLTSTEAISASTKETSEVSQSDTASSTSEVTQTSEENASYNVTESVDTSGLKPVESQSNNDRDTFTMQDENSLGNQHNKIMIQDGKISITRLNMGTDTLKTNDVKLKTDGDTVTLSWDNQSLSFTTDDKGKDWLETNLQ